MARKRQYKKRQDYRKGGRVRYQTGGAPQRKDYDTAREYNIDLAEYRKSQPAQPAVGNIGINRPQQTAEQKKGATKGEGGDEQTTRKTSCSYS